MCAFALRTQFVDMVTHTFINSVMDYLREFDEQHRAGGWRTYVTDSAAIGRDYEIQADLSLKRTQWITVTLVVVILLLLYRSVPGPAMTLATVVLSLHAATCVIAIIGAHWMKVPKLVPVYMMVIMYGSVTDFSMFIIGRFREELARGHSRFEAVRIAVSQVGAATTASALTTIAGLAMMAFADFEIFRATGPILGVGLAMGLLASITFLPALMVLFGRHLFWPSRSIATVSVENTRSGRFWGRVATLVVQRPGLILVLAMGFFLPFAVAGFVSTPSYDIFQELPPDSPSVLGYRVIQDTFPETSRSEQITIVLKVPEPPASADGKPVRPRNFFSTYAGLRVIDNVTASILEPKADVIDNVTVAVPRRKAVAIEVRSATRPYGAAIPAIREYISKPEDAWRRGKAGFVGLDAFLDHYVRTKQFAGSKTWSSVTRITVVLGHRPPTKEAVSPFSKEALDVAKEIRYDVMPALQRGGVGDAQVYVGGVSGHMYDVTKVTRKDLRRLRWNVLLVLYVILSIMLRGAIAPLYLLATMVLNYFATMGIVELIFVNGLGAEGLDWKVEFFLFVLLVAIGVDYNIYIMSRLAEEVRRRPFRQALHHAIVFTGSIITSCGIIMAGTFASMTSSTLAVMVEIGAAMAVGVLLDTFLVRPLVVPAIALLIEKLKERWRGVRPV
jgi:RND superfamily putative drug exporter